MHAIILIYLLHHVLIRGEKKIKKNRFFKIIIFCEYNRFLKLDERNKNFEKNWLSGKLFITVTKVLTSIEFGQWTNPFGHLKIFFCINLCTKFQVNKLYISRVREVEHFYPPPLRLQKDPGQNRFKHAYQILCLTNSQEVDANNKKNWMESKSPYHLFHLQSF